MKDRESKENIRPNDITACTNISQAERKEQIYNNI